MTDPAAELRSVVITGTSTGIGAATAHHLAGLGFRVFAGVRNERDAETHRAATPSRTPIMIDVADATSIAAAVEVVSSTVGTRGLFGLVNNAGIVRPGPLEFQPLDDFRLQLEVNLIGHLAVTQAFLPLIRLGKGRIVNVGSIGGRLVLPLHGAYSVSKFGMEALSDALRLELRQWRIPVSLVDPGATATAIFGKTLAALDELRETLDAEDHRRYDEQIAAVRRLVEKTAADTVKPIVLARAIAHALTSDKPKTRYLAGKGAKEAAILARTATDHIKDLAIAREVGLPNPE